MSSKSDVNTVETTDGGLDLFGRYLSVWVALAIVVRGHRRQRAL